MAVVPAFQISTTPGVAPESISSLVIEILPEAVPPILNREVLAAPSLSTLANEPARGFPTT